MRGLGGVSGGVDRVGEGVSDVADYLARIGRSLNVQCTGARCDKKKGESHGR